MLLVLGFSTLAGLVWVPSPASAWAPHAPIVIVGNAEFTGANGVTGGSGTPADPFVIEGWEIDGSANSGIEVYNTDAHFVIRDVYLHSALIDGIFLFGVQNARVDNATMPLNDIGVYIQVSSNVTVASSNISFSNLDAIEVDASSNITVEGNEMWNNGDWGVFTYESDDLVFRNNTIANNGWAGIELNLGSDRVTVEGNHVANNNVAGFIADNATNITIVNNTFPDNDFNVDLTNAFDVLIRNNTVATSTSDGVTITGGARLTIEGNTITGNGGGVLAVGVIDLRVHHNAFNGNLPQASDVAGSNAWDDGYPSGGNYWSDYAGVDACSGPNQDVCPIPDGIGDTPYVIDADSRDRYPLMQPFGTGRPGYTVTFIPPLPGDLYTIPWAVNESGAVVGWSTDGGLEQPFLYTDATGTVPLLLGTNRTRGTARDLNAAGVAVGGLYGPDPESAVRWPSSGSAPEELGVLGTGPMSHAWGMNMTGAVVGWSDYGGLFPHAFLYTDAAGMVDLTPNQGSGAAYDVTDGGRVVGYMTAGGGLRAFRWDRGILEDLGVPGGFAHSFGFAINEAGQVAGCADSATGNTERIVRFTDGVGWEVLGGAGQTNCAWGINAYGDVVGNGLPTGVGIVRAFLFTDAGGMQDLERMIDPALSLRLLDATDINNRGQIVGYAWDNTVAQYRGYRLDPSTPPPSNRAPTVTVLAPNGGEFWGGGSTHVVEWRMTDLEDGVLAVAANLSVDGGATFPYPMFSGSFGQGRRTLPWTLPSVVATSARVRVCVTDSGGLSACDVSDRDFTIDPTAVAIVVDTNPTGFQVRVDGVDRTAPYPLGCAPASTHSVEVPASLPINASARYGFVGWSDGGALAHDIVCDTDRTVTASYWREFPIVLDTSPSGLPIILDGATFTAPMTFWCDEGSSHSVQAVNPAPSGPDQQYVFQYWLEDGSTQGLRVITCTGAARYTAVYTLEHRLVLDTSPPGLTVVVDGVTLSAPATIWCPDSSVYGIGTVSPQFLGGDRYEFSSWSDGGAQFHLVACTAPATIIASFLGPFFTAPSVIVTSPDGGEDWTGGSSHPVTWTMSDPDDATLVVYVNLSLDGGATYPAVLFSGTLPIGPRSSSWTLPFVDTADARVRVCVFDSRGQSACDAGNGTSTIDSTRPVLLSTSPPNGATNVDVNASIVLTFSEPMNRLATEAAVSIAPSPGPLAYSWDAASQVLTIRAPWTHAATYTVTIGCGAQDDSGPGNLLQGCPLNSGFTTAMAPEPPQVAVAGPAGGEVWTGGASHSIEWTMTDPNAPGDLSVDLAYSIDGGATWIPILSSAIRPQGLNAFPWAVPSIDAAVVLVRVCASDGALSGCGTSLALAIDSSPPGVSSVTPPDGARNVSVRPLLSFTFSERMNATATQGAVSIAPAAPGIAFRWDAGGTVLTVEFGSALAENTDYVLTVGCGARDDSDPGNALVGCPGSRAQLRFRTEILAAPPVASVLPVTEARVGVAVTFDGRGSTGDIAAWVWTVTDGTGGVLATLSGPVVTYAFAGPGTHSVILRVTDTYGRSDEHRFDVGVLAAEEGGGIAWVLLVVGIAVVGTLLFAASEPGRVALVNATAARLYARRPKDEKDSEIRGAIDGYIRVHPGDTYTDVRRNLDLNDGVVTYHLAKLEKDGRIQSQIRGARKRYYPVGVPMPLENGGELHEIQQRIVRLVAQEPGMPVSMLAEQLGVSSQLALYHVRKLAGSNHLGLERHGLRLCAFPGPPEA